MPTISGRYRLEGEAQVASPYSMTYDGRCNDNRECRAGEHCSTVGKNGVSDLAHLAHLASGVKTV